MEFVYAYVVGIKPIEPGFRKVSIEPKIDVRLNNVKASYKSVSGNYKVNWKIESDGKVSVYIHIPFGCTAEVLLPGTTEARELESGTYNFNYIPEVDFRRPYSEDTKISRLLKDEKAVNILRKYVPILTHILSGNKEMSANTLRQISFNHFMPFDPSELEKAISEISDLIVE